MKIARILTYLGLIPFIFLPLMLKFDVKIEYFSLKFALLTYSALILSFLGGIYFFKAIELEKSEKNCIFHVKLIIFSIFLQIFAWIILISGLNYNLKLIAFIALFLVLTIAETYYFTKFIDENFLKMRCKITAIVIIFLSLAIENDVYRCDYQGNSENSTIIF